MIVSSTLILTIALDNEKAVVTSVTVCNYSLLELNEITSIRLLFRSLLNTYLGYGNATG
jgi:hypothetical protein